MASIIKLYQSPKRQSGQWYRSKSYDTFSPLGPRIVLTNTIQDPQNLNIKTIVNGKIMQDSNTNDMMKSVAEIISFCSDDTLLAPGTVICTGSPSVLFFLFIGCWLYKKSTFIFNGWINSYCCY